MQEQDDVKENVFSLLSLREYPPVLYIRGHGVGSSRYVGSTYEVEVIQLWRRIVRYGLRRL